MQNWEKYENRWELNSCNDSGCFIIKEGDVYVLFETPLYGGEARHSGEYLSLEDAKKAGESFT